MNTRQWFDGMVKDMWMNLNVMLANGEITEDQANEWADYKTQQWKDGAA